MKVATVITALALTLVPMTAFAADSGSTATVNATNPVIAAASHAAALREQAYLVTEEKVLFQRRNALVNNGVISRFTELQDSDAVLLATNSESEEAKILLRELGYLGNFIAATESTFN